MDDLVTITCDKCGMSKDYNEGEQFVMGYSKLGIFLCLVYL